MGKAINSRNTQMFQLWIDFAGLQNRGQSGAGRGARCSMRGGGGGKREGRERVMYILQECA